MYLSWGWWYQYQGLTGGWFGLGSDSCSHFNRAMYLILRAARSVRVLDHCVRAEGGVDFYVSSMLAWLALFSLHPRNFTLQGGPGILNHYLLMMNAYSTVCAWLLWVTRQALNSYKVTTWGIAMIAVINISVCITRERPYGYTFHWCVVFVRFAWLAWKWALVAFLVFLAFLGTLMLIGLHTPGMAVPGK